MSTAYEEYEKSLSPIVYSLSYDDTIKKNQDAARKRLQSVLNRFKYKHNWSFTIMPFFDCDILNIEMRVPDATGATPPGIQMPIVSRPSLDEITDFNEWQIIEWLQRYVLMMETHEMNEWFKIDDKCYTEPHPATKAKEVRVPF